MSYHSPWRWTDGQLEGLKQALAGLAVDYRVFQMDAKRATTEAEKQAHAAAAVALIESWHPDLVYVTDDDAQRHVTQRFLGSKIPFVFSGVNQSPEAYGFPGSSNVTGVLEVEHFVQSVNLLRRLVPNARRIVAVFDDSPIWEAVRGRMAIGLRQLPDVEIVRWDVIHTFAEFRKNLRDYPAIADAIALIGVFEFKDAKGRNVPYQQVMQWTVEHSGLPDFSFWIDRIHYGTLCAVTVSEREQGLAAGRLARAILTGRAQPSDLPMRATQRGTPVISLARAKKLGLKVRSDLMLTAEVVTRFEWSP